MIETRRLKNVVIFVQTIIIIIFQFSKVNVAANYDITPISVYVQRFTVHVYDWSILNDQPIQNIDLLTSTSGSLCNIAKCLTYACSPK